MLQFSFVTNGKDSQERLLTGDLTFGGVINVDNPEVKFYQIQEATKAPAAIAFPRNSEFKDLFDYHIKAMREKGLLFQLSSIWIRKRRPLEQQIEANIEEEAITLGFTNLMLPSVALLFGVSLALLISLIEFIIRKIKFLTKV